MSDWETIEAPVGSFIGWGGTKGQHVTGKVLDFTMDGGTDFGGNRCPQISIQLTEDAASFNKAIWFLADQVYCSSLKGTAFLRDGSVNRLRSGYSIDVGRITMTTMVRLDLACSTSAVTA
jgi:hypothetical protein